MPYTYVDVRAYAYIVLPADSKQNKTIDVSYIVEVRKKITHTVDHSLIYIEQRNSRRARRSAHHQCAARCVPDQLLIERKNTYRRKLTSGPRAELCQQR